MNHLLEFLLAQHVNIVSLN